LAVILVVMAILVLMQDGYVLGMAMMPAEWFLLFSGHIFPIHAMFRMARRS